MATKKSEDTDGGRALPPAGETEPGAPPAGAASGPLEPASDAPLEPLADPYAAPEHTAGEASNREVEAERAAAHADAAEDEHEEERGWSFAARALTALVLLLAGAALGIWAAPRIAPALPAGLAPVAAWLAPVGSEAEARIAAIESRVEGELGGLGERIAALPDADAVETAAQGAVEAARGDLAAQIEALRAEVERPDAAGAGERIGRLETALEGATAELASLKAQIDSGTATLSADASASIDTTRAELEGLRAEVGRLAGSVSGFGARLDETEASADARVTAAQQQAQQVEAAATAERDLTAARADFALIRAALASGAPFEQPLTSLAASAGVTPPESLRAAAASGVATPAALRTSFADAAHEAIRASIVAGAGEGVFARSRAFLESQVASRSLTPRDGMSPDAVLSRMEDALRRDDLATALAEANQLPSEALAAMQEWLAAAKLRADAEAGLAELSASAPTLN